MHASPKRTDPCCRATSASPSRILILLTVDGSGARFSELGPPTQRHCLSKAWAAWAQQGSSAALGQAAPDRGASHRADLVLVVGGLEALELRIPLRDGLAQALDDDLREEGVHHAPSILHLLGVCTSQGVAEGELKSLANDWPMLLVGAVVDVPRAELQEHGHQGLRVVQACDCAPDGVHDLAEKLLHGRRVVDVALIADFVRRPVVVLRAHVRREERHRLRSQGEGVAVEHLADDRGAEGLDALPTLLDGCLHLAGGQRVRGLGEDVAWSMLRRADLRDDLVSLRDRGKPMAATRLVQVLVLAKPPLELQHVAAWQADGGHV
mmetsp:Transcript_137338/g.342472  ORF Transcript_137338/g.342472 Transcript_137338/m.342472 type:complete len:323 (+) Transcript_137338:131-1099(+)